jgi:hypothetical protein
VIIKLFFPHNFETAFFDKRYRSTNTLCYNNLTNGLCISRILRAGRHSSMISPNVNKSSSPAILSVNRTFIGGCSPVSLTGTLPYFNRILGLTEVGATENVLTTV